MQLRLHRFESLDSTSEEAFRRLEAGQANHGDVFVARSQTRGRGRRGRPWTTTPGDSIALSVVVRPRHPVHPALLTLLGGLSVLDVAHRAGVEEARLKWPNDLLARGAKLAGVLVESRGFEPTRPCFVLGIGFNVRQREFPPELRAERAVTSLALAGSPATTEQAEAWLTGSLAARLEDGLLPDARGKVEREFLEGVGVAPGDPVRVGYLDGREPTLGTLESFGLQEGIGLRVPASPAPERIPIEHVAALEPSSAPGH